MSLWITRDNVDQLLDAGRLEIAMANGRWWSLRRNGRTRRWKTNATRFEIPVKAGLRAYATITQADFNDDGTLRSVGFYRMTPTPVPVG